MSDKKKTISHPSRVGLKDVAKLAGVSPATVSRALGDGPVSEEMRERVERAVELSGYSPNLAARRLRSKDSGTIGLLVADICNPFFTAISRAVEEAACLEGWRVIFCNSDEDPNRESAHLKLLAQEQITGLIMAPTRSSSALAEKVAPYPVILIDRVSLGSSHDAVTLDNQAAVANLVEHLVAQGFRRIGGLFGNTSSTGLERRDSFIASMQSYGLTPEVREISPTASAGEQAAHAWLSQGDHPEALIGSNSFFLMGIVKAANALGLAIPADLAVAGFDNEPWTEVISAGLTVIEQPVNDIGQNAIALLKDRITAPSCSIKKVVLQGRLIARGSTVLSRG